MLNKRILVVSSTFYPENSPRSFRTTELVKEFARQGHEVTLLTLKNDEFHIPFEKEHGVTIKDIGPLYFPKISVNGESGVSALVKRAVRRGLLLLFEYPNIELMQRVKSALKNESGYDLLISIAVPHPIHWGVARAWDRSIAGTWVADCGDPFMGNTMDSFRKLFYFKYFEKDFCRKADVITVPVEEAREGYYPEFREKIEVVPQGFNFNDVEIDHTSYIPNPVPTFAYAGGFIPDNRDPRKFLDYLVTLDREYKFIIYTRTKELVEPYAESANGKIEIRDYIPRKELLKILSGMDFLINFENRSSQQSPSKLIDYYIAERPVLSIPNSDLNKEVIQEFLNGNYDNQYDYRDIDQYRIENVCKRFSDFCKNNG